MRPVRVLHLAIVVAVLCVVGCSSNNKGKIEGTKWSNNAQKVKGNDIPAGVITLEFKSDGGLVYAAPQQTYTGKYSLGAGDTVTFNLDQELSGRKTHAEKITISGESLTMTDSDGTALTFKKVK